ncbi:MAG: hypothetical protein HOW73_04385 [Polyangiaceae bacterium]|nr:hypothetical protein [Polyangiaceae bacterium]
MRPAYRASCFVAFVLSTMLTVGCSDDGDTTPTGGAGEGGSGEGGSIEQKCAPGEVVACFTGLPEQENVGLCRGGERTCEEDGSGFGPCEGEVLATDETCANPGDEDCDGLVDEEGFDCACEPGDVQACYSGPPNTEGNGPCKGGTQVCNADGDGWGPCDDEVLPVPETCTTDIDDDCDGQVNEGGAGCDCTPNATVACYTGPAGTLNVGACKAGTAQCNADGTELGPCTGEVKPADEACLGAVDLDCDGETNETTTGCTCTIGDVIDCYTGAAGTEDVGVCHGGQRTCETGDGYSLCAGQVTPTAEQCSAPNDEDCDGTSNEGCLCSPGATQSCYTGPAATLDVGICHAGTQTCAASGQSWGACMGQVVPMAEVCGSATDNDCDGIVDEKIWSETTVDTHEPGEFPVLVVDASGGVHALYHDVFFDHLDYAYKAPGGSFVETTVDTHEPASEMQLVVDASGGVHALYHDTLFGHLVYAYKAPGGSFAKTTVDTHAPGPSPKLVVDASGGVHALYHDTLFGHLDYAYKAPGGSFVETTVDTHVPGAGVKLVVDASGGVHALYHDVFFDHLDYAYKAPGGSFVETTVDTHEPGSDVQLSVDASGGVHALYVDALFDHLDYAYKAPGGSFVETTVDTHTPGPHPKLVVDGSGGVHALYQDTLFDHLDYAYKAPGGSFVETTVDTHEPAPYAALVVQPSGVVHALYHDVLFDHLDYAYKPAGGSFIELTVDTHTPGAEPKLVVDGAGGVHAVYADTTFGHLDYAYLCP